jgi:hypothetical protein
LETELGDVRDGRPTENAEHFFVGLVEYVRETALRDWSRRDI